MAKQFTLGKNERLKSRKQIELLFKEGNRFTISPFRIYYLISDRQSPTTNCQLLFGAGVSSRYFKKAVDRNRIKRLVKEAYRLQKNKLLEKLKEQNKGLNVFFIYTGKELPDYKQVYDTTTAILDKLCDKSGKIN